jgi:hypothetical protein
MKGFCELLCWVSTRALGNKGYLTINTRSNRVVFMCSLITRIFFNSVHCLGGHISTCFNKDTCDLFMLCIMLVCQLNCVVFIFILLFNLFHCFYVRFSFRFC